MSLLITGGNGLIGSEFKDGIKVGSGQYNLINQYEVEKMFLDNNPDYVIHTAAKVGGLGANMGGNGEFFYQNIIMNTNVLHYAMTNNVKKLICFLSTCVFPNNVEYPLTEDKVHLGPPHNSNYGYAYAKRMAEVQVRSYNQQYGTNFTTVIPTNVYGPKDNYSISNGHVIPSLIHKCYLAMQNNTDLEIWGTGTPLREFIFSRDVANICEILLNENTSNEPVIISTSDEISIANVVNIICDVMGFKNKIIFNTDKPDGQFRKPSDNKRLKSIIGDYKFVSLEEGLHETVNYFIENYNTVRK